MAGDHSSFAAFHEALLNLLDFILSGLGCTFVGDEPPHVMNLTQAATAHMEAREPGRAAWAYAKIADAYVGEHNHKQAAIAYTQSAAARMQAASAYIQAAPKEGERPLHEQAAAAFHQAAAAFANAAEAYRQTGYAMEADRMLESAAAAYEQAAEQGMQLNDTGVANWARTQAAAVMLRRSQPPPVIGVPHPGPRMSCKQLWMRYHIVPDRHVCPH
ncbi:hypothetical protein DID99_34745 [Burkholderia sp. Bp8986]|nr:hypothetical protein DID99_34745 [Burkholderia sp. Bp8986]